MRRLLLGVLLVPLFVSRVHDPTITSDEPVAPAGFPQRVDRTTVPEMRASALLLPLDAAADGFTLTSMEQGVRFDIDGDGDNDMVAWPAAGANVAFLARDINGDGRITSGKELFGTATVADGRNGCAALLEVFKQSEGSLAGSIRDGHELYERLLLWVDRNHDGRSERSELSPVRDHFTAIGMGYGRVGWADVHGNRVRFEGWMQARTAGPLQGEATDPFDEMQRRRRYFEVRFKTDDR